MFMHIHFETVHHVGVTFGAFELEGGVTDVVFVKQNFIDRLLNGCALADRNIVREDVRRESTQTTVDAPHVDVMQAAHSVHSEQVARQGRQIHVAGGVLEQDVERLAQDGPGVPEDEQADQDTDQRVEDVPAGEPNHHTRDDRSDGRKHVTHQVDEGRAQVKVMVTAFVDQPGGHGVDEEGEKADADENVRLHFGRRDEALVGFIENKDRDDHQRSGIRQRGQDPCTLVTVGASRLGGLGRQPHGKPTQSEREYVGEVVSRVREQSQAVRPPASNRFDDNEGRGQREGEGESARGLGILRDVEVGRHFGN